MSTQLLDALQGLGVSAEHWQDVLRRSPDTGAALNRLHTVKTPELARRLGLAFVARLPDEPACDKIPEHLMERWKVWPLALTAATLTVAAPAPLDPEVLSQLRRLCEVDVVEVALSPYWVLQSATRPRMRPAVTTGARRSWGAQGVTFAVADVEPARELLPETATWNVLREQFQPLEACSDLHSPILSESSGNSLIQAAYLAFTQHRPLVLSPDILWLTILHGVSLHIAAEPERHRSHYVRHRGQERLVVDRPDFVLGSPENPWEEMFAHFDEEIGRHVSEWNHRFFQADFSTSGPVEKAAARVLMMSALQHYFFYEARCICGIPSLTLEGTPTDWRLLEHRAQQLCDHGLGEWSERLAPLLAQFVRASEGEVDRHFWGDLFQMHDPDTEAYGGPVEYFSGWIAEFCLPVALAAPQPLPINVFPPVVGVAPLHWVGKDFELDLEFCAGLLGVEQRPEDMALRPQVGWVVRRAVTA